MTPLRIGQFGIGHAHAGAIMRALRNLPDHYEVVGYAPEPDPGWPEPNAYDGLPQMTAAELLDADLEAASVETNMPLLVETSRRCLERGLHLHLDKPGGETMPPFRALVEGCRLRGLQLQLGYMYRVNPGIQLIFRAVREGWLGEIFEIHALMSRWDGDRYRAFLSAYAGGAMYPFGSHLIDLVVAMLGRPDKVHAYLKSTRDDGLLDNGLAVLEYPKATATIRASVAEVDGMRHRRLIVCGTRGTAEICPLEQPADRYRTAPLHVRLTLQESNEVYEAGTHLVDVGVMQGRYEPQLIDLARAIRGEAPHPYGYDHELLTHEVVLAACGLTTWGETA